MTGDTVTGAIVGGPGAFAVDPPSAVVGAGVEFIIEFVGTPAFEVDIGAVSMEVSSVFGQPISTGAGEVLVLGDLHSTTDPNAIIVGITNFQTNEPEITLADITFTDHEVRLAMSPTVWEANGFVSWDVEFSTGGGIPGDFDGDGDVDQSDLGVLLSDFGCVSPPEPDCPGDINGDGQTDQSDLGILLANFTG
jgi:hypothetical protein